MHMDKGAIGFIIGMIVFLGIILSSIMNKEELKRYQSLKNKKRFGGRKLPISEQIELDDLAKKYWWY